MTNRKPFFLKKTVSELERLSGKEAELVRGIANLTLYVHKDGDKPEDTVQRLYPQMQQHLKDKVSLAIEYLLTIV
jgi:hypothetical protein